MTFHSILFNKTGVQKETVEQPDFFTDLNLEQIIEEITSPKQEYNLKPFFYTPLHDVETIYYRHEVMRELADEALLTCINAFAKKMAVARRYLAQIEELRFEYHKKGWFLEAALVYCQAVTNLVRDLRQIHLKSDGFLACREYVTDYVHSPGFEVLQTEAQAIKNELSGIKYSVIVRPSNSRLSVRPYDGETDYAVTIEHVFERFKQGAAEDYLVELHDEPGMNHIEAQILEFVSLLYPESFDALNSFCAEQSQFIDETVRVFDREIQFYLAYLEFIAVFKRNGLPFCYPQVSATRREVSALEAFDLALAGTLLSTQKPTVCNDFSLQGSERFIVVSGPNQGGKNHICPDVWPVALSGQSRLPGAGAGRRGLFLSDQIFTHFDREEDIRNLRGKLQDDLVRIHDILAQATPNSILILNELFASTTFQDAVFLSRGIMTGVLELDSLGVWVTFIDELSTVSEKTVSMMSTVDPDNPGQAHLQNPQKTGRWAGLCPLDCPKTPSDLRTNQGAA